MITPGRLLETAHFTLPRGQNRDFVAKLSTKIANLLRHIYAIILNLQALIFMSRDIRPNARLC